MSKARELAELGAEVTVESDGDIVINDAGDSQNFRVESDANGSMFYVDGADNRVGVNTSDPQHTFHVNQTADSTGIALGMSGRGNSRAQWVMSGVGNEGFTFQHYDGTDTADLLHMNRGSAQFARYANLHLEGSGLKFDYYRIRNAFAVGYNTTVDTGISVNGGHAGRTLLVMMTGHTSDQNNTQSALYLVRCGYNGNYTPTAYSLGGNYSITVGKSASNTITLHSVTIPVYQIMEISVGV